MPSPSSSLYQITGTINL
ncbi:hypothetical protein ACLK1V_22785 [Escherichia coli]